MSTPTARTDRRQKWWSEKRKSRANKREGLRPNPSSADHFVIPLENKGGFKPSTQTKHAIEAANGKTPSTTTKNKKSEKVQPKTKNNVKVNNKVTGESVKKKNNSVKSADNNSEKPPPKNETKYVLFVGNLPFSVTKENLEEHFRKTGGVKNIRIPQDKAKQCSRGFAYIEFKDRISHGIALRLHHTTLAGRKINVEFTSIGGGKNENRKEKLRKKNEALAKHKMALGS